MDFAPLAASLEGRLRKRGKHLIVTDPREQVVMVADREAWQRFRYANVWNADGAWRIQETKAAAFARELSVIDSSGGEAASMRNAELLLPGGETLTWAGPRVFNHACGFVGGLWVAKRRAGRRRFRAELSTAMLAREDRGLIAAIAAVLTCESVARGDAGWGSGDFGLGDLGIGG